MPLSHTSPSPPSRRNRAAPILFRIILHGLSNRESSLYSALHDLFELEDERLGADRACGKQTALHLSRMLCRGIRTFCSARVPVLARRMSAPVPTGSAAAPKRALSTSPPASSLPTAVTSSTDPAATSSSDPAAKKVKLTVEDPVSVPPNLVEEAAATTASETSFGTAVVDAPKPAASSSSAAAGKSARKPRQRKGKAPKPGGVEEAGAFDVIELLGAERVKELQRLQEEEGRDWTKEADLEWGKGPEGKDVEVRVVGSNDHGAYFFLRVSAARRASPRFRLGRQIFRPSSRA